MKPIDSEFRSDQFDFKLLKREGLVALFEKSKPSHTKSSYEVVVLRHVPETQWPNGLTSPAREIMPSSEKWGTYGWSYSDLESALKRFESVSGIQSGLEKQVTL